MNEAVVLPGGRDVRGTLDRAETAADVDVSEGPPERAVVACPPDPRQGGNRSDARLTAVAEALGESGIDCLRFDYGPWDEGRGERSDARAALRWATERYETVGLFGYSFGGAIAILAAAEEGDDTGGTASPSVRPAAVSALAPAARLGDLDVIDAIDAIDCPLQVIYGSRDDTVDGAAVAEQAARSGHAVEELRADHFFVGRSARVAELVATFLDDALADDPEAP